MSATILSITVIAAAVGSAARVLSGRGRTLSGLFLAAALLVTAGLELLALLALFRPDLPGGGERWFLAVEALLPGTWLLASVTHGRETPLAGLSLPRRLFLFLPLVLFVPVFGAPLTGFYYSPDFAMEPVLFLGSTGFLFYCSLMALYVAGLVNLETTLTNAAPGDFWKLKFTTIGIGTALTAYALYYSQALLFRSINLQFLPVRSFFLLAACAMLIYGRLRAGDGVRIRISRQVAFKSVVLIAVGAYLVLIGLIGEGMRYFGAELQQSLGIGFIILSGIALVLLLLSGRVRREIRVFLHKNFYQSKYDYRVQWLQFTERLASRQSGANLQQVILTAYCETFGVQSAALYLLDQDRHLFVSTAVYEMDALSETFTPDNPLVRYIDGRGWVFRYSDSFLEIPPETAVFLERHRVSFVVPLLSDHQLEGFIVLGRQVNPKEQVIYEDFDLMKTIARQASFALRTQRLSEQLSRSREMEAIGNISTFVIHDLKNHVAGLSLMVDNARHYIDNPEFQQDMLSSLDTTVGKMQGLIARLKNLGEKELLNLQPADLLDVAQKAAAVLPAGRVTVTGESLVLPVDADEMHKVILNLLLNAVEASPAGSPVTVEVAGGGFPGIRVMDQGSGMSAEFISRELFKPFATTKKKGLGIGLFQSRQIVEAHSGRLEVQSEVGKGTVFTVRLKGQ